ncbi:MAG TPA: plasmid replication initiator TrfA [Noviherbaspirillum sp.]|nr:plasmid replication initiator TrfA [Noviherbaspirillum sp.]
MKDVERKIWAKAAQVEIQKYAPQQLSFWPDDRRAIANELARSALFQARDKRKPRAYFDNEPLFMLGEGALTYKGEELRVDDEDVFITLAHRARELPSGKMQVRITSSEICKDNNWRQSQAYYTNIFKSIQRMKAGAITVFSRRLTKALKCQQALDNNASSEELAKLYGELADFEKSPFSEYPLEKEGGGDITGMMFSLVSGEPTFTGAKSVKDGIPQGNLIWEITLDRKMVLLFAKPFLTLVDKKVRTELSATGKRVQSWVLSHKKPYPVKLRSLEKMIGASYKTLAALKYNLGLLFDELVEHEVIHSYELTPSADKLDWLVTFHREPPTARAGKPGQQSNQSK